MAFQAALHSELAGGPCQRGRGSGPACSRGRSLEGTEWEASRRSRSSWQVVKGFRKEAGLDPFLRVGQTHEVPAGSGQVVLVLVASQVMEGVAEGRVHQPAKRLALLPVPGSMVNRALLEVASQPGNGSG